MPGTKLLAVKFPWASAVKLAKITRASSARDTKIVAFGAVLPEIVPCFGSIVILLKESAASCPELGISIWTGALFR